MATTVRSVEYNVRFFGSLEGRSLTDICFSVMDAAWTVLWNLWDPDPPLADEDSSIVVLDPMPY